jgi:hypothetical protein
MRIWGFKMARCIAAESKVILTELLDSFAHHMPGDLHLTSQEIQMLQGVSIDLQVSLFLRMLIDNPELLDMEDPTKSLGIKQCPDLTNNYSIARTQYYLIREREYANCNSQ